MALDPRLQSLTSLRREAEKEEFRAYQLRVLLEEECGTSEHPKADLLWSKAWKHGRANGHADVEYWYRDLAELLQ